MKSGHYTCVCRGPHGRYWYYDDGRAVVALQKEVSQVKPREVYLLVYCPVDGCAEWQGDAGLLPGVGSDGADAVTGFGGGADVCGAGASGGRSGNGGREKTGGGEGTPRGAVSAWGKPAARDGGVGAGAIVGASQLGAGVEGEGRTGSGDGASSLKSTPVKSPPRKIQRVCAECRNVYEDDQDVLLSSPRSVGTPVRSPFAKCPRCGPSPGGIADTDAVDGQLRDLAPVPAMPFSAAFYTVTCRAET